jgi:hypothetical protein
MFFFMFFCHNVAPFAAFAHSTSINKNYPCAVATSGQNSTEGHNQQRFLAAQSSRSPHALQ